MTVHASSGWLTKLDEHGWPTGPALPLGAVAIEGAEPDEPDDIPVLAQPWHTLTIEITALDLRTVYLLFGSRRVFGWPRPLAINGHEYRRRVRRR